MGGLATILWRRRGGKGAAHQREVDRYAVGGQMKTIWGMGGALYGMAIASAMRQPKMAPLTRSRRASVAIAPAPAAAMAADIKGSGLPG